MDFKRRPNYFMSQPIHLIAWFRFYPPHGVLSVLAVHLVTAYSQHFSDTFSQKPSSGTNRPWRLVGP